MDQSKSDTVNNDIIEIKKRKQLFAPVLNKFKMLRGLDRRTRELEETISNDINEFINKKADQIEIEEDNCKQLISIINSTKITTEDKKYLQSIIVEK